MSQQTQNLMKKISLAKVVLNMGIGKSGEPIEIGKNKIAQKENLELSQNFGFFNFIYIYLLISF